jgi:hypothetical protein
VKEFDPTHWGKCCEGLTIDTKAKCHNKGCFAGAHKTYEDAKKESTASTSTMNPLIDPPVPVDSLSQDSSNTTVDEVEEEEEEEMTTTPKKDPNPCVSPDGNYLVMDCMASIKNRQFQNLVDFHFRRKSDAGGLNKHSAAPFTYVSPVNEEERDLGECDGEFTEAVDVQRMHFCGMHAINNAMMLPVDQRVTRTEMRTSAIDFAAVHPQVGDITRLYSPGLGDYSVYVVGDRLSRKTGRTVHQYFTTGANKARYMTEPQMMEKLRSKNIVVATGGHYVALRPIGAAGQWCYIDSLGGGGAGTKKTMTAAQVRSFLLGSRVISFLTVDKDEGGDNMPPLFHGSQDTYNPGDNVAGVDEEVVENHDSLDPVSSLAVNSSSVESEIVDKPVDEGLTTTPQDIIDDIFDESGEGNQGNQSAEDM